MKCERVVEYALKAFFFLFGIFAGWAGYVFLTELARHLKRRRMFKQRKKEKCSNSNLNPDFA